MITFCYRRSGDAICSYSLEDGTKSIGVDNFLVGDGAVISFNMPAGMKEAMADKMSFGPWDTPYDKVIVPLIVVRRRHALEWVGIGVVLPLTLTIHLEAASAEWEDVLLWVTKAIVPPWAKGEEMSLDERERAETLRHYSENGENTNCGVAIIPIPEGRKHIPWTRDWAFVDCRACTKKERFS